MLSASVKGDRQQPQEVLLQDQSARLSMRYCVPCRVMLSEMAAVPELRINERGAAERAIDIWSKGNCGANGCVHMEMSFLQLCGTEHMRLTTCGPVVCESDGSQKEL